MLRSPCWCVSPALQLFRVDGAGAAANVSSTSGERPLAGGATAPTTARVTPSSTAAASSRLLWDRSRRGRPRVSCIVTLLVRDAPSNSYMSTYAYCRCASAWPGGSQHLASPCRSEVANQPRMVEKRLDLLSSLYAGAAADARLTFGERPLSGTKVTQSQFRSRVAAPAKPRLTCGPATAACTVRRDSRLVPSHSAESHIQTLSQVESRGVACTDVLHVQLHHLGLVLVLALIETRQSSH
jgi:hypothetical protein